MFLTCEVIPVNVNLTDGKCAMLIRHTRLWLSIYYTNYIKCVWSSINLYNRHLLLFLINIYICISFFQLNEYPHTYDINIIVNFDLSLARSEDR